MACPTFYGLFPLACKLCTRGEFNGLIQCDVHVTFWAKALGISVAPLVGEEKPAERYSPKECEGRQIKAV